MARRLRVYMILTAPSTSALSRGAVRPRCKNGGAVVVSKVSEGFVQGGLITAAFGHRGLSDYPGR